MILSVSPVSMLSGRVAAPASKSYSIRAFIIAACGGVSEIVRPSECDDAVVAMDAARFLGANVTVSSDGIWKVVACREGISVTSHGQEKTSKRKEFSVGESGTVLRFLLPLLSKCGGNIVITGKGTLRGRPNLYLIRTLRDMGVDIRGYGDKESIPVKIKGGSLKGGDIYIDASLSSQFISALLITAPMLDQDTRLHLTGSKLVSSDYIDMTINVLKQAGIKIIKRNKRLYIIKGNQRFKGLGRFVVPSDYGLVAFMMAAASIIKSNIILSGNFSPNFIQADARIIDILSRMGVNFIHNSRTIKITGPFELKGGDFSLKDSPDLVPIVSILALFAKTRTRLYNIHHARAKESDRISDLRRELLKIGARVRESENEIIIYPSVNNKYKTNIVLDAHNDHRLAMSFYVLGLKLGVRVKGIESVSKSYPGFVRDMESILR